MKIELISIPVTDTDRSNAFYFDVVGSHADPDHVIYNDLRFVQLTPPGPVCSLAPGLGVTAMAPGSVQSHQMVIADVAQAHRELAGRSVEVSDVQEMAWARFVIFSNGDGNGWSLQALRSQS